MYNTLDDFYIFSLLFFLNWLCALIIYSNLNKFKATSLSNKNLQVAIKLLKNLTNK